MESMSPFTSATAAIFIIFITILFKLFKRDAKNDTFQGKLVPKVKGSWPIIGHLHLLAGPELAHKALGLVADKYGPIFMINLGSHRALVVSDSKIAKECFTTNDKVFANRPKFIAVELMGYNHAILGFAAYGPYWREVRKATVLELLSSKRVQMLGHARDSEIKIWMKEMFEKENFNSNNNNNNNKVKLEMSEWFEKVTLNVILQMIFGRRFPEGDKEGDDFKKALRRFAELLGVVAVSDVIPWLKWVDLGKYGKEMRRVSKEMDVFMEQLLAKEEGKKTFMGGLVSRIEAISPHDLSGFDTYTIVKATCLTVISGGTDTTTSTLTWAIALLLNHPKVMEKARQELEINVGKGRQVQESDLNNLIYLQAIIKETMRLYPVFPLSVPHMSTEDCIVAGYNIPKGTRLFINVWKIQHNPQIWEKPDEFIPERFLTMHKDIDVRGQHYELMPFGSGRRMCVGMSLAVQVMQLSLASLLHGFDMEHSSGDPIDMTESQGIINHKVTPLEVVLSPRLSPDLY